MTATSPENANVRPAGWAKRIARGLWRCSRTAAVVLVLSGSVLGLFLNKVGLPEFVKARVVAQARAKGLEVQFSRLRLRWYRGIVAESLQIRGTNAPGGLELFVEEAECPLSPAALASLQLRMNSLHLRGGRLIWPLAATNEPRRTFVLNGLNGDLSFQSDGRWELHSMRANFHGVKAELNGSLANAMMVRDWKTPRRGVPSADAADDLLSRIELLMSRLKLSGDPELRLKFSGDGKDRSSLTASLYCSLPELASGPAAATNLVLFAQLISSSRSNHTPSVTIKASAGPLLTSWGQAQSARIEMELTPPPFQPGNGFVFPLGRPGILGSRGAPPFAAHATLSVELIEAETRWGQAERFSFTTQSDVNTNQSALAQTRFTANGERIRSRWGRARSAQLTAAATHPLTNWAPARIASELRLDEAQTDWGDAQLAELRAHVDLPPPERIRLFQTNLAWPERLGGLPIEAAAAFTNLHSPQIDVTGASFAVETHWPQVRLASSCTIAAGQFQLDGSLTPATREFVFAATSSVDPHSVAGLLSTNSQKWLSNCSFQSPPRLAAQGRMVLPAWTNRQPDWTREALPSITMAGRFDAAAGNYRGVTFTSAQSPFTLTNLLWRAPALKIVRPEGAIEADYTSNPLSLDFHSRLRSQIDAQVAKAFFQEPPVLQVFDFFRFTSPPDIQAEIWGRWGDLDRLGGSAVVIVTNFSFRGEAVKNVRAQVQYTNKVLLFTDSQVSREGGETGGASLIALDLGRQKLFFTNGFSTLNPYVVARAIGKTAIAAIESYQYDKPPSARVNGVLDLKRKRYEEDMHFEITGNRFHWQKFQMEQLMGRVDWVGQTLALTNVVGSLKKGRLDGNAHFDFTVPKAAEFTFKAGFDKADLREVTTPFIERSNKLEGLLTGELVITQANTGDFKTWQGHGRLNLHDGLVWDIPMFGLFSPVLNGFLPGLGNSRANEADATFIVTNGVFFSKDTEIHATMMRMLFKGSVGINRRVDARVEAELLRDVPAVGLLISKVFWPVTKLFEYKVTGTLLDPKAEPLYVLPKILLMPFHPFKTLKGIFVPEDPKGSQ